MIAAASASPIEQDVWHALSDPTRRHLIDRLADGPKTTSTLCEGVPMTRYGVMKHIGVLERAGLITARRHGWYRMNHLNRAPLAAISERWLTLRASAQARGFETLKSMAEGTVMATSPGQHAQVLEVTMDWSVNAAPQTVWRMLIEGIDTWWPLEHRAGPEGARMQLMASPGGGLIEVSESGAGLEWYRVIAVDPMKSIDLAGHLASRYGGPATSLLHIALEPGAEDGVTVVRLTDSLVGRLGINLRSSITSGWEAIIGQGLMSQLGGSIE